MADPRTPAEIEAHYVAIVAAVKRVDEMRDVIAEARWRAYQSHLDAGFSAEQALFLCRSLTFD